MEKANGGREPRGVFEAGVVERDAFDAAEPDRPVEGSQHPFVTPRRVHVIARGVKVIGIQADAQAILAAEAGEDRRTPWRAGAQLSARYFLVMSLKYLSALSSEFSIASITSPRNAATGPRSDS